MQISGSIGITILKNEDKIIVLLADDHSNSSYCNNDLNHQSIKEYLEHHLEKGNQVLLEEVPRDGFELQELWPESPHTQSLKNFFLDDDQVTGIDIRPYLIPFSFDTLDTNKKFQQIKMKNYIKKLDDFFNLRGKYYEKVFKSCVDNVILKNSGLGKNLKFLLEKFKKIKNKVELEDKIIKNYYENDSQLIEDISKLCDEIMEFSTLLRSFSSRNKSIIHAGLFHSYNMLEWLKKEYGFEVIYQDGINDYNKIASENYNSCIKLPNELFGFKD